MATTSHIRGLGSASAPGSGLPTKMVMPFFSTNPGGSSHGVVFDTATHESFVWYGTPLDVTGLAYDPATRVAAFVDNSGTNSDRAELFFMDMAFEQVGRVVLQHGAFGVLPTYDGFVHLVAYDLTEALLQRYDFSGHLVETNVLGDVSFTLFQLGALSSDTRTYAVWAYGSSFAAGAHVRCFNRDTGSYSFQRSLDDFFPGVARVDAHALAFRANGEIWVACLVYAAGYVSSEEHLIVLAPDGSFLRDIAVPSTIATVYAVGPMSFDPNQPDTLWLATSAFDSTHSPRDTAFQTVSTINLLEFNAAAGTFKSQLHSPLISSDGELALTRGNVAFPRNQFTWLPATGGGDSVTATRAEMPSVLQSSSTSHVAAGHGATAVITPDARSGPDTTGMLPIASDISDIVSESWQSAVDGQYMYFTGENRYSIRRVKYPRTWGDPDFFGEVLAENYDAGSNNYDWFLYPTVDTERNVLYYIRWALTAGDRYTIERYDLSQGPGGTFEVIYAEPALRGELGPLSFHPTDRKLYCITDGEVGDQNSTLFRFDPDTRVREDLVNTYGNIPFVAFESIFWRMATSPNCVFGVYAPKFAGTVDGLYCYNIHTGRLDLFDPGGWPGGPPGVAGEGPQALVGMPDDSVLVVWYHNLGREAAPRTEQNIFRMKPDAGGNWNIDLYYTDRTDFAPMYGELETELPGWTGGLCSDDLFMYLLAP